MGQEIWLFLREKIGALGRIIRQFLRQLWHLTIGGARDIGWSRWRLILMAVPLLFFTYIGAGMLLLQRVDADLSFAPAPAPGASHTVATVSGLVKREVVDNDWLPNDPIFMPGWWLDNTPYFQRGMIGALSRFTLELRDQIGRTRGSSAEDTDLEGAAGNLSREPDRWVWDLKTSLWPTAPSDSYFREATVQLDRYNARLSEGSAVFERRADNLRATLDRIALDLGASSAALDSYIRQQSGGFGIDYGSDNLFFQTKGQIYAYLMIIQALEVDFKSVIQGREVATLMTQLKASLTQAIALEPWYVANGALDGVMANHLAMQGFYLLRARTQLREITSILMT